MRVGNEAATVASKFESGLRFCDDGETHQRISAEWGDEVAMTLTDKRSGAVETTAGSAAYPDASFVPAYCTLSED